MNTYFDSLETLLNKVADTGFVAAVLIREAMEQDQHRLFHDAEFHEGCKICDKEREENQ
jgi:hypothetical protein